MIHDEPQLISSIKSQRIVVDGYSFAIEIHRLDNDRAWTPEFVDHQGTSHVWEEQFKTDRDARCSDPQRSSRRSRSPGLRLARERWRSNGRAAQRVGCAEPIAHGGELGGKDGWGLIAQG